MLLEELRLLDNQVYGVAHGLLMSYEDNVWIQAQSLFDEVKQMDSSTASAFYNALTDMLWHFGQVICQCFKNMIVVNMVVVNMTVVNIVVVNMTVEKFKD